jgi:hypothetical protein
MGTKHNDSCLAKAAPDEPLFVLRAQDRLAPKIVRYWAMEAGALGRVPFSKVNEAFALADRMEAWQREHGCKDPD